VFYDWYVTSAFKMPRARDVYHILQTITRLRKERKERERGGGVDCLSNLS
jgi:hypothetical protein